jgi:mycofactocin system transcriptional regulator
MALVAANLALVCKFLLTRSFARFRCMTNRAAPRGTRGRPEVTSHSAIERAATLVAIAGQLGVGRRTIFRYYESKNDIPWGQFDQTLDHFRALLDRQQNDVQIHTAVHRAVVDFNRFPEDSYPPHRERMRLILTTPELQAHSVLRYADWRRVISEYVALRTGAHPNDIVPQVAGHVSLALSLTAYEAWLAQPESDADDIVDLIDRAMAGLRAYLVV